jgi:uncharacterized membrane protein
VKDFTYASMEIHGSPSTLEFEDAPADVITKTPSLCFFIGKMSISLNLVIIMLNWISIVFTWSVIAFYMKYFSPENIYVNIYMTSMAAIAGTIFSGLYMNWVGFKVSLMCSNFMISVGMLLVIYFGLDDPTIMPFLLLFSSFGASMGENILYQANSWLFPTLFTTTSMAIFNFAARTTAVAAPLAAEIDGSTPLWIVAIMTGVVGILSFGLKKVNKRVK